jgi:hypothetical protein
MVYETNYIILYILMFQRFNVQFRLGFSIGNISLFFVNMDVNIFDVFEPDVGKSVLRLTDINLVSLEKTKIQLKFFVARMVNALSLLN